MSPEMDAWLARRASDGKPAAMGGPIATLPAPAFPLTEAEFAWLWPHFQKCRFGGIRAARSFARTSLEKVTPRGKEFALRMAFRHRTQIFGKGARKFTQDEFLGRIREAARSAQQAPP